MSAPLSEGQFGTHQAEHLAGVGGSNSGNCPACELDKVRNSNKSVLPGLPYKGRHEK